MAVSRADRYVVAAGQTHVRIREHLLLGLEVGSKIALRHEPMLAAYEEPSSYARDEERENAPKLVKDKASLLRVGRRAQALMPIMSCRGEALPEGSAARGAVWYAAGLRRRGPWQTLNLCAWSQLRRSVVACSQWMTIASQEAG